MLSTIAAVKTATGFSASVVSRGIGTIIQRVIAPTTKNFLRSEGVEMFDEETKKFRGIIPVLQDISELAGRLDKTSESGKRLLRILSGISQQSIGSTLLDSLDQIETNLETTSSALFVLERDAQLGMESWTTKIEQMKATYQDLFNTKGKSPLGAFGKDILDVTRTLAQMEGMLLSVGIALTSLAIARSGVLPAIGTMGGCLASANRQKGFRGVAGVAHQRIGIGGGYMVGAEAAFYGAASIDPTSRGGAIAKGGLHGLGAGFLALSVGASPLVAAFAALTVGAIGVASSLEEVRLKAQTKGLWCKDMGLGH